MPSSELIDLRWDHVRIFRAAAASGSFSGAARHLGSSQPTVGRQITALETALGGTVFRRTRGGLVLTEMGTRLRELAEQMDRSARALVRRAQDAREGVAGEVRLSVPPALGVEWLTPRLGPLLRQHPLLEVAITTETAVADVSGLAAHIAVRLFRPDGDGIVMRRLRRFESGLFADRGLLKRLGPPRAESDLARFPLVGFERARNQLVEMQWLRQHVPAGRFAFRSDNALAQRAAIEAGLGLGILPLYVVRGRPALRRVLPHVEIPTRSWWLAYHEDLRDHPPVRALAEFLLQELASG